MTHTAVEELQEQIDNLPIVQRFKTEFGDFMTEEYKQSIYDLFSTFLDGLVMEDNFGHSWACDDEMCVCENHELHKMIKEHNQRLQSMKQSLGETK